MYDRLEEMFRKLRTQVEEKYGKRTCDLELRRIDSHQSADGNRQSNSSGSTSGQFSSINSVEAVPMRCNASTNDMLNVSDNTTRVSASSQFSVDSMATTNSLLSVMPKSRVLSSVVGGITRRRSNARRTDSSEDSKLSVNRGFSTQSSHSSSRLCVQESMVEESRTSSVVVVSNRPALSVSSSALASNSRPSSGHFVLTTSTPNHSRSPSMTSNRDSLVSSDGMNDPIPPPVPPKPNKPDISFENLSIASLDEIDGGIYRLNKKRPPPPPPQTLEVKTPPTPPRKPPFRPTIE